MSGTIIIHGGFFWLFLRIGISILIYLKMFCFQTGEELTVSHLQYVAWPDHGVPDESSDFLEFVNCVRQKRIENQPILVHCR